MLKPIKADQSSNKQVLRQDHRPQLLLIECECGTKILLLPDLKEMDRAIQAHVTEHKRNERHPKKTEITAGRIRQNLVDQVIEKAAGAYTTE